jgi:hypothetical protein
MQYGMFYMQRCEHSGGQEIETLSHPPDCPKQCMYNIPYCIYNCLSEDEPTRFETCRRHHKIKY